MQYVSKYEKICQSVVHFLTKTGGKNSKYSKVKFKRAVLSFHKKFDIVKCSSHNRGRVSLRFEIA
jgi:hypothetical protein